MIAHLPPKDSGDFAHFGPEYHYDEKWPWHRKARPTEQMGNLVRLLEAPLAFVGKQLRWFRDIPFRYSWDDHAPQHYVSRLTPPGTPTEFGDYDLVD